MTMYYFFVALMVGYVILLLLMLIRVLKGPTVFDRLNGIGVIGLNSILMLIIFGKMSGRVDMYIDIAVTYAIIGFAGSVVIAKYLYEGKKGEK